MTPVNAQTLRRAMFSAALLLAAAPAAFADPPGYDFMDFNQPAAMTASAAAPTTMSSAPAQSQPQLAAAPSQPQFACTQLSGTRVCIANTR
jgi:hypothetical protein